MPSSALIIIAIAVLLPVLTIVRFVVLSRWFDRLNEGLPSNQQFQLIGLYTPSENLRLWRRWREVRNQHQKVHPPWWIIAVVLPWAIGLVFQIHEWNVDRHIAAREQTTAGVIFEHQPANHNVYGYRFEVSGRRYVGWQSPGKNELSIGKQVTVYYDPHNPEKNALTDFDELSTSSLGPVPLLLFGIGGVVLLIRRTRRSNAAILNSPEAK